MSLKLGSNTGFGSKPTIANKFGGFGKKAEPAAPPIKLSEDQLLSSITDETAINVFINVYSKLNNKAPAKKTGFSLGSSKKTETAAPASDKSVEEELKDLIDEQEDLYNKVIIVAHQIDTSKEIIKDLKHDLDADKSDNANAQHAKSAPTPFIERYIENATNRADNLSKSLASYESRFQTNEAFDTEDGLTDLLTEQYEAVIRTSTRIANLSKTAADVRSMAIKKLKITSNQLSQLERGEEVEVVSTNASQIKSRHEQFETEKREKNDKKTEDTDLFGMSLA